MPTPTSASEHYRRQQRLTYATVAAMVAAWRRMQPTGQWVEQYREEVGPRMVALAVAAQVAATTEVNTYIPAVLSELGIDPDGPRVPRAAFASLAGDGRPVETLLEQSIATAARAYDTTIPDPSLAATEALASAERWISLTAATLIADTSRAAESAASAARPQVAGYVRMLNPPSCSRCAILAGKFYRWNDGFQRHPRCDCRHIPASEAIAGDLTTSVDAYFESLPSAEQDRIFTANGAKAIRDGADINQVVNARRGMQRAQVYGRKATITTEGTTRRGVAYRSLNARFGAEGDVRAIGERYARTSATRLMPESIYEVAADRDDAIRLLRLHGYIA